MQSEIQEAAYQAQMRMESEETVVVGVNAYRSADPAPMEILNVDAAIESTQREHLSKLRKARDDGRVEDQLKRLKSAAEGTDNLMPIFIDCLEADVTLGEICGRLRAAWGEHVPAESF